MTDKPTLDTNILIYAFGKQEDARKQIAKEIITKCNIISLQVVNETIYVLLKKFKFPHRELEKIIEFMKQNFVISDINIADQYGFPFWDSMIVASALSNHCSVLYSEDLQNNQIIDGRLQIINPFANLQ